MSTFIDIEQALARCGQGQFEKVVGAILDARGIPGLALLGSVVGKEKTRAGVPDAFASVDGRSFSFAACTTETGARNVENKLVDDIAQCADVAKTGVSVEAINVLYLAFNSVLPPDALSRVASFAEEKGLRVNFLSVSELAGDLSRRYTWLAKEFFGIQVDTGQVLSIDAFVHAYDQGLLATPLNTPFLFRGADLADALHQMSQADLVIKGAPGTGKTRFALELVRTFSTQGWRVRCVLSSQQPVIQDIDRHFSEGGQYAVLLDDANRVSGLDPVVRAIRDRVGAQNVRFVFTVRNYALREVRISLTALRHAPEELELFPFTQEETEKFLHQGFEIRNGEFQRQIWRLSKGNARLATMAAKLALETQHFSSIIDLTRLYDAYYRVPVERADSKSPVLMPALALLSVLKSLHVDHVETIATLEQAFGWVDGSLWKAVLELNQLECVDLHRGRVARVSDQVLASYAFFVVFVDRRVLSFRTLVELFGASRLGKIRNVLFDIQHTMDRQRVLDGLKDDVSALLRRADGSFQLKLLTVFWYFDPNLALEAAANFVEASDASLDVPTFDDKAHFAAVDVLALLACFAQDNNRRPTAVHLALRFMAKQPERGGEVLSLLTDMGGFGIHQYSEQSEFRAQKDVADAIRSAPLLSPDNARCLLIRYATKMLRTDFEGSFLEGRRITISRLRLTTQSHSPAYRGVLWDGLVECVAHPGCFEPLNAFLWDYANQGRGDTEVAPTLAQDLPLVKTLFLAIASHDRPADCALATALNRRFGSAGLDGFTDVAVAFESDAIQLLRLVGPDWESAAKDFEAEEAQRRASLTRMFEDKDASALVNLFLSASQISGNHKYDVVNAWQFLVDRWAEQEPDKLLEVTEFALQGPMALTFHTHAWVTALLRGCGKEVTRRVIDAAPARARTTWLEAFLASLPTNEISQADIEEYLAVLARPGTMPLWLRHLRHYMIASQEFLPRLIETLLSRDDAVTPLYCLLSHLGEEEVELVKEQMRDIPNLMTRAYLVASIDASPHSHFDHNASLFNLLIDLQPKFIAQYVQARAQKTNSISRFSEDHRDYGRLWQRPDWPSRVIELLAALSSAKVHIHEESLVAWLPTFKERGHLPAEVLCLLQNLVVQYFDNEGFMRIIFSGVCDLEEEQRLMLLSTYLERNQNLEEFKALSLLPSHWGGSGSMVPVLQRRVRFLERVMELMTTSSLVGHRMHVSEMMRGEQWRVDKEVENDFVDPD